MNRFLKLFAICSLSIASAACLAQQSFPHIIQIANDQLTVDCGQDQGVKIDDIYHIMDGDWAVGCARVESVEPDKATLVVWGLADGTTLCNGMVLIDDYLFDSYVVKSEVPVIQMRVSSALGEKLTGNMDTGNRVRWKAHLF